MLARLAMATMATIGALCCVALGDQLKDRRDIDVEAGKLLVDVF
jgi:hypothetical protein